MIQQNDLRHCLHCLMAYLLNMILFSCIGTIQNTVFWTNNYNYKHSVDAYWSKSISVNEFCKTNSKKNTNKLFCKYICFSIFYSNLNVEYCHQCTIYLVRLYIENEVSSLGIFKKCIPRTSGSLSAFSLQ